MRLATNSVYILLWNCEPVLDIDLSRARCGSGSMNFTILFIDLAVLQKNAELHDTSTMTE
jgi:hypothetical protein